MEVGNLLGIKCLGHDPLVQVFMGWAQPALGLAWDLKLGPINKWDGLGKVVESPKPGQA